MRRVTTEQWAKVTESVLPTLRFYGRLKERLWFAGMHPDDPYYQAVVRAYDAIHAVRVRTHYLSCDHGVASAPDVPKDATAWIGEGI